MVTGNHQLPDGWEWTTLGKLANYINGRAFKPTDWETTGKPIIRIQNLTGSTDTVNRFSGDVEPKYIIRDGDLLISWSATLGAFIYRGEEAVLNQHIFKVEPFVNKKFLYYLVTAYLDTLKRQVHGSGMQHITKGKFDNSPVPLPPPDEQERIVAKIEELFTQVEAGTSALERVQAGLRRYKASVLKAAVEGKLVAQDENDEPASELLARILTGRKKAAPTPETSNLPELPKGWVWSTLAQLIDHIEAGHSFKAQGRPANNNELGVIKVSAMSWEQFLPNENKALFPDTDPENTPSIKAGDLLISRANTVELVGAVVLVEKDYPNLLLSDKSLRLVPVSEEISKKYLLCALRTKSVRDVYQREATGTSDSMRNLSQDKILMPPIPLPPVEEQRRIVAEVERRLSVAQQVESSVEEALVRASRLRQAVLRSAFEGRLM